LQSRRLKASSNAESRIPNPEWLRRHFLKRLAVRRLKKMIRTEQPDIIHVKGRVITEAWPMFPPERTIYQHTLMGTVDPSWEPQEVGVFSGFLNRCARIFVQGEGIAKTFAESFKVNRPIDVVPTMVPDEVGDQRSEVGDQRSEVGDQRSEIRGQKSEAGSRMSEVGDRNMGGGQVLHSGFVEQSMENAGKVQYGGSTADCRPPTSDFRLPTSGLRFGIICRFTEQKGIKYILEALQMFKQKHGAVNFVFAGQGPMEVVIREFVRSEGMGGGSEKDVEQKATKETKGRDTAEGGGVVGGVDGITAFAASSPQTPSLSSLPFVQNSSVRTVPVTSAVDVLKNLDVFVHPGLDDAMPVSIVEALMCGVPVIGSSVGATPELVRDGVEGFIVPPADAGAIFEAMDRFAAMDADELAKFRQAARARYEEKCTPSRVGGQVAAIYREVVATKIVVANRSRSS